MSWVTIVWSMAASACLTLAALHLLVWSRRRTAWANLLFAVSAAGTAAYAGCELWMMRAQTPGEFGMALECLGAEVADRLFLQIKEATIPAHAPYLPVTPMRGEHQGFRVVAGQRALQALGDPMLGYTTIDSRPYYVRQMKNMKASMPVAFMTGVPFDFWAFGCGMLLARAHARSGDAALIAGYCGDGDTLDRALADFAEAYGDQTERDHAELLQAIKRGRVPSAS